MKKYLKVLFQLLSIASFVACDSDNPAPINQPKYEWFQSVVECKFDAECKNGLLCINNVCIPEALPEDNKTVECQSDSQCGAGFACQGTICVKLEDPPDPDCMSDLECPANYICDVGVCVDLGEPSLPPVTECDQQTACKMSYECKDGKCVKKIFTASPDECKLDGDCRAGLMCKFGKCVTKPVTKPVPTPPEPPNDDEVFVNVTPKPKKATVSYGSIKLDNTWNIVTDLKDPELKKGATFFKNDLAKVGLNLEIKDVNLISKNGRLVLGSVAKPNGVSEDVKKKLIHSENPEAYVLDMDAKNQVVSFYGATPKAAFWAAQSFWWILKDKGGAEIPAVTVVDWPDVNYRYYHHSEPKNIIDNAHKLKIASMPVLFTNLEGIKNFRDNSFIEPMLTVPEHLGVTKCPKCALGWKAEDEPFIVQADKTLKPKYSKAINIDLSKGTSTGNAEAQCFVFDANTATLKGKLFDKCNSWISRFKINLPDKAVANELMPGVYSFIFEAKVNSGNLAPSAFHKGCRLEGSVILKVNDAKDDYAGDILQLKDNLPPKELESILKKFGNEIAKDESKGAFVKKQTAVYISKNRQKGYVRFISRDCEADTQIEVKNARIERLNGLLKNVKSVESVTDVFGNAVAYNPASSPFPQADQELAFFKDITGQGIPAQISVIDAPKGKEVLVDYSFSYSEPSSFGQVDVMPDIRSKETLDYIENKLKDLQIVYPNARLFMLTFDEVREYNRDLGGEMSNAKYFAEAFNKRYELIKKYFPKAVIFTYGDMLIPTYSGGGVWAYYLNQDKFDRGGGAYDLIDPQYKNEVIFVPWSYGYKDEYRIIQNSLTFLAHFDQKMAPGANWSRDNIMLWNYYLSQLNVAQDRIMGWFGHCYSDKCADISIEVMKATGERAWNEETGLDAKALSVLLKKNHAEDGVMIDQSVEICNGQDDNGNGMVDEVHNPPNKKDSLIGSLSCANYPGACTVKTFDSLNCGACGKVCYPGDCVNGECVLTQ